MEIKLNNDGNYSCVTIKITDSEGNFVTYLNVHNYPGKTSVFIPDFPAKASIDEIINATEIKP